MKRPLFPAFLLAAVLGLAASATVVPAQGPPPLAPPPAGEAGGGADDSSPYLIPGEPYGRIIESIEILGLSGAGRGAIERAMSLREGERYTRTAERQTTANIWNLYLFENVAIRTEPGQDDPEATRVFVELDEQPLVGKIEITGNASFPDESILEVLPFAVEKILPINAAPAAEEAIKGLYQDKGYNAATAELKVEALAEGFVGVEIRVREGRRLRVDDIEFTGNEAYTGFRLGFHIQTSQSWFFISNYFNEEIFEIDLESVADFYRSQGYLTAQVREGDSKISDSGDSISLEIKVEEGPRFTLRDVVFEGFSLFTEEELKAPFENLLGDPFLRDGFVEGIDELRHLYGNEGWTQAVFDPQPVFVEGGDDEVDFLVKIDEGQRITVGAIEYAPRSFEVPPEEMGAIEAFWTRIAPPVKPSVVLKRVELQEGETLRLNQLEETERNLKRLQVFRDVKIQQVPTGLEGVRDIRVETEPRDTAWLLLRASTSSSGTRAGFQLVERNLGGDANAASLSATFGQGIDFSATFLDRDFQDSDWSARYTVYRNDRRRRGYDEVAYGASSTFSHKVRERVYESWRLRLADVSIDPDSDVEAKLDDYQVAAVRYQRAYDWRDDFEWPEDGFFLTASAEGGYAGTGFVRLGFEYDRYQRLGKRGLVWAMSARGDVLPLPSDRDDLGINERLFLGGRGSVRGYRGRGIAPKDRGEEDLALGGLTSVVLRNELRFPIAGESLKGLFFADAGFLGEDSFEYEAPRASTGFGLRLLDERISIGVDFGFALNAKSEDDTQVVQFAIDSGI